MAAAEQSSDPVRDYGSPATWGDVRADLRAMESRFNARIAEVRADIRAMEGRLNERIAELRTEIARGNERMTRWTLIAAATGMAAITALVGILAAI